MVAAALLHDSVEKTDVSHEQVRSQFGPRVADLVAALTEPTGIADYAARKAALRDQVMSAGPDAQAIFAADKLESVSSLLAAADGAGVGDLRKRLGEPLEQKLGHYEATLALLEQAPEPAPFLGRLRSELGELSGTQRGARALAVARRVAESISGLDAAALGELCRRDVEWWSALTLGTSGLPYRGRAGMRRYVEDLARAWEDLHIEVHEHRQLGDQHVAIWDVTARARVSARAIAQQSALVYSLRDRLIATGADYLDAADAVAAAAVGSGTP